MEENSRKTAGNVFPSHTCKSHSKISHCNLALEVKEGIHRKKLIIIIKKGR